MDAKVVPGPGANGRVDVATAANNASRHSIQSVDRALLLLETIADMGGEATLTELANRTRLNISTCHHLLATLIKRNFVAKVPGENINVGNVHMDMTYAEAFKRPIAEAYERLLLDCMRGDATLFNRRDSVDRAWELIQPVLQVWEATPGVHFVGRLATYKYYNMDQVVAQALALVDHIEGVRKPATGTRAA